MSASAVLGGLIFGLGAGANGACSFSTLVRLADGHLVMLFTLAGWPLGMLGVHLLWPALHQPPVQVAGAPVWFLVVIGPWMAWHGLHILRRLHAEGWGQLRAGAVALSLSVTLVAMANFGILALDQLGPLPRHCSAQCGQRRCPAAPTARRCGWYRGQRFWGWSVRQCCADLSNCGASVS